MKVRVRRSIPLPGPLYLTFGGSGHRKHTKTQRPPETGAQLQLEAQREAGRRAANLAMRA